MRGVLPLLLFFVSVSLYAEAVPVEKKILFTATHPFKSIEGHCEEIRIEALKLGFKGTLPVLQGPALLSIPLTGMKTGNSNRDSHMLEVLGYPDSKAIEGRIEKILPAKEGDKLLLSGTLKINGIEKPFQSTATSTRSGDTIVIEGGFDVMLPDFDVEPPDLILIRVADLVKIRYRFRFKP